MTRRRVDPPSALVGARYLATGALALAASLALAPFVASGAAVTPRTPSRRIASSRSVKGDFSLARLAGLRDYTFTYGYAKSSQGVTAVGEVHGPTDWRLTVSVASRGPSVTTYDVGGHGYSLVKGLPAVTKIAFKTPEGLTHLNGEETWAEALVSTQHVAGVRVDTAGACRVAGQRGTVYDLRSPAASQGVFAVSERACVGRDGALLSFTEGVAGGSAAGAIGLAGKSETFSVTSIGRVGEIRVPKGPATSSPTTTVPAPPSSVSGRLPSGFPSAVPAPPGTIMSATRLSPTKWYALLTETSSRALATYVARLESKGFSVSTRSTTAASSVIALGDASFRVVLEEMTLQGEGVTLAVSVGRT